MPEAKAESLMKDKTLALASKYVLSEALNREHSAIDDDVVEDKINELVKNFDDDKQAAFEKMKRMAAAIVTKYPTGKFRPQIVQSYMCTVVYCDQARNQICCSAPGSGKTYSALQLAFAYLNQADTKVYLLTISEELEYQMESMLGPYLVNKNVVISSKSFPQEKEASNVIVIIDEADLWVVQNAAVFQGSNLTGVCSLFHATKVIFLTATATEFLQKVVKMLNKSDDPPAINVFQSKAEYCGKASLAASILPSFCDSEELMIEKFYKDVQKHIDDSVPVLVFAEKDSDKIYQRLNEQYGKRMPVIHVTSKNVADLRNTEQLVLLAIYVMEPSQSRGTDLKLGKDAHACIIQFDRGYAWSETNQIVGRACRSFGVATGTYYMAKQHSCIDLKSYLLTKELQYFDGIKLLQLLYTKFSKINNLNEKAQVIAFYKEGKWCNKIAKVQADYPVVWKVLKDDVKKVAEANSSEMLNQQLKDAIKHQDFQI